MTGIMSWLCAGFEKLRWYLVKRIYIAVYTLQIGINDIVTGRVRNIIGGDIERSVHQILSDIFFAHSTRCRTRCIQVA